MLAIYFCAHYIEHKNTNSKITILVTSIGLLLFVFLILVTFIVLLLFVFLILVTSIVLLLFVFFLLSLPATRKWQRCSVH